MGMRECQNGNGGMDHTDLHGRKFGVWSCTSGQLQSSDSKTPHVCLFIVTYRLQWGADIIHEPRYYKMPTEQHSKYHREAWSKWYIPQSSMVYVVCTTAKHGLISTCTFVYTVEPLNNRHIGMDHYREVVLFQR